MMKTASRIGLFLTIAASTLPARAEDDATTIARAHYNKGTKAYDLGRYIEAAHEYEAAYEAKDDPSLLFNIGQAFRLGGDHHDALRAYKSFLRRVPDVENRHEVEARIVELQKSIEQLRRAKEGPPEGTIPPGGRLAESGGRPPNSIAATSPPRDRDADLRRGHRLKIVGLAVGGFGVAALGAGSAFAGLAGSANRQIVRSDESWSQSTEDRRDTYQTLDAVFLAVGGVAVATGLTLYLYGRHESRRAERASLKVAPVVGGARVGAVVAGAF